MPTTSKLFVATANEPGTLLVPNVRRHSPSRATLTPVGKRVVTMSEASVIAYECPGCGKTIEPGEDYVVAREYPLAHDFTLHMEGHADVGPTRRFHVEHFRGHLGDHVYELIDAQRL